MKGDFSRWDTINEPNLNGVLHQQGRVLLDRDWNDQTRITLDWQNRAAKQIIGADVAAISTQEPNALKVTRAFLKDNQVKLEIHPGQGWVNGLAVTLPGDSTVTRTATYFEPPLQDPSGQVSEIKAGVRDAVILEVWQEALNGFQRPDTLLEPALGGPDTTERVLTAMRLRLFRLAPDEDCHNISDKLQDDISQKGKLKVSLEPTTETPTTEAEKDCPVVESGGYTGFEHNFYRIEIAQVNDDVPMFKWSQFNGGLVGRGKFEIDGTTKKITLKANDQAIKRSGLSDFYLEVVEFDDEERGYWRITYGAEVTLDGDDLNVTAEHYVEPNLPSGKVFFRLWNGIDEIVNFPKPTAPAEPNPLRDGIRLEFDAPNLTNYQPGDYWTFKVRAGEIVNDDPIFDNDSPPQSIEYYRVPLAELNWDQDSDIWFDKGQIEDCRHLFRSLTKQKGCCKFTVGDGDCTHGDFDTIEDAIRNLPSSGGKICLLPGLHKANVELQKKENITIEGCGKQTCVIPRQNKRESAIFHIIDSECIALLDLDLATLGGTAIVLEKTEFGTLKEIEIGRNRIIADKEAIHVKQGIKIHIHHNQIRMWDKKDTGVAIYLMAEDSLIERNDIGVIPAENTPPMEIPNGETLDRINFCINLEIFYTYITAFVSYINLIWAISLLFIPQNPFKALGGIQIAGGSERVKILENKINGGAGNGIALGSSVDVFLADLQEEPEEEEHFIEHKGDEIWGEVTFEGNRLRGITVQFESENDQIRSSTTNTDGYFIIRDVEPGEYQVSITTPNYKIEEITSQNDEFEIFYRISVIQQEIDLGDLLAFMYEIEITDNHISNMGLSGIGIPRIITNENVPRQIRPFVRFLKLFGNPIIDLKICNNKIKNCWQNEFDRQLELEASARGFGGISLGIVANLVILENRIEDNGSSHIPPTCGIFLSYGEIVEIAQNWIINNGAIASNTNNNNRKLGKRGGIIAIASSIPTLSALSEENPATLLGKPAARLYDNRIEQPVGQALGLVAMGAISINNNYFKSERSGVRFFDQLVGGVSILNFGGLDRMGKQTAKTVTNKTFVEKAATHFTRHSQSHTCLPNGNTLFNNNQTYLGLANTSFISQFIVSADDIGFDSNQSDALGRGLQLSDKIRFTINTWVWGATLRANSNRFKEGGVSQNSVQVSLITLSTLMNNTTNNQGDHCIFAFNTAPRRPAFAPGNQVLDTTYCGSFLQTSQG